jgi:hypothetical protein
MAQVVQTRPDTSCSRLEAGRTQQVNADFAQAFQSVVTAALSLEEGQIKRTWRRRKATKRLITNTGETPLTFVVVRYNGKGVDVPPQPDNRPNEQE